MYMHMYVQGGSKSEPLFFTIMVSITLQCRKTVVLLVVWYSWMRVR